MSAADRTPHRECRADEHRPWDGPRHCHGNCVECGEPWPCSASRPSPPAGATEALSREVEYQRGRRAYESADDYAERVAPPAGGAREDALAVGIDTGSDDGDRTVVCIRNADGSLTALAPDKPSVTLYARIAALSAEVARLRRDLHEERSRATDYAEQIARERARAERLERRWDAVERTRPLCADHRDKARGECLLCRAERLERERDEARAAMLRKHEDGHAAYQWGHDERRRAESAESSLAEARAERDKAREELEGMTAYAEEVAATALKILPAEGSFISESLKMQRDRITALRASEERLATALEEARNVLADVRLGNLPLAPKRMADIDARIVAALAAREAPSAEHEEGK